MKTLRTLLPLLLLSAPLHAAVPADGELTAESLVLEWTGSGPYVVPNTTSESGEPVCMPPLPLCDEFTLNVNIADEFRELPENQRESVRIGISFPTMLPTIDYDVFVYGPEGTIIGEGTGSFGVQETVSVPLKTLKNGSYRVVVEPYTPFGTNYTGAVQVGKQAKTAAGGFSLNPQAGSAPLTVTFDARGLASQTPAGGYQFDFGDGSAPVHDADGVVEHTYTRDGEYLSRVQVGDTASAKPSISGAQTVFVGAVGAGGKSGTQFGGALGWGLLLLLLGSSAAWRRNR